MPLLNRNVNLRYRRNRNVFEWMTSRGLHPETTERGDARMLYTFAVILLVLWLLGVVGTYTIGAFVHVLLVIALVLFVLGLMSGRRTVI